MNTIIEFVHLLVWTIYANAVLVLSDYIPSTFFKTWILAKTQPLRTRMGLENCGKALIRTRRKSDCMKAHQPQKKISSNRKRITNESVKENLH